MSAASESPEYVLSCIEKILPDIAKDHTSPAVLSQVGWKMLMLKLSLNGFKFYPVCSSLRWFEEDGIPAGARPQSEAGPAAELFDFGLQGYQDGRHSPAENLGDHRAEVSGLEL